MTLDEDLAPLTKSGYTIGADPQAVRIAILLGGHLTPDHRVAVAQGAYPRVDVLDMEEELNATLYDFTWMNEQAARRMLSRMLLALAKHLVGWSAALALFAFPTLRNYDLVYTTGEDVGLPLAGLLRVLKRRQPQLILRMEQPLYGRTKWRRTLYNQFLHFGGQRVNLILCRTPAHVRYLTRVHGFTEKSLRFVPETTDTDFFNLSKPRVETPNMPTEPFILSAGLEMRDYDTLIEAVQDLPVKVVIAAGSPWSQLQFSSHKKKLPANVQVASFLRPEMRELYRAASIVVLPVRQTTRACGMNVILEAWAMERPVIASGTEGLVDYIDDGQTGLLFEVGNFADLRAKIMLLLQHPEESERLARNGHQHVVTKLNLDNYLEEVKKAVKILNPAAGIG